MSEQKDELDNLVIDLFTNTGIGRDRDRSLVDDVIKIVNESDHPKPELCERVLNEMLEDRLFLHWTFGKLKEATVKTSKGFRLDVEWSGEPSLYKIFRFMKSNETPPPNSVTEALKRNRKDHSK